MGARKFWLVVMIWALMLGVLVTCAGVVGGGGGDTVVGKGDPDIDLEAVLGAYKKHVAGGAKDLTQFEQVVNASGWYSGKGVVSVRMRTDGAVVGFVDANGDSAWTPSADKLVFVLEADHDRRQLYASDRHRNRYRIGVGDIFTYYLISRMFDRHRGHYGGWHGYGYRSFHSPGYYRRYRTSRRWGGRGAGGSGGRRSYGGRSYGGGWGGK